MRKGAGTPQARPGTTPGRLGTPRKPRAPRSNASSRPGSVRSMRSARSDRGVEPAPSDAPSEMTLPDWSDAASLQEWDLVDEHFLEKPQTPGGLMNRTIARSPRKVGDWKSASYALVREAEEEFAAVA